MSAFQNKNIEGWQAQWLKSMYKLYFQEILSLHFHCEVFLD